MRLHTGVAPNSICRLCDLQRTGDGQVCQSPRRPFKRTPGSGGSEGVQPSPGVDGSLAVDQKPDPGVLLKDPRAHSEMALELVSGADFWCKLMSGGRPVDLRGSRGQFPG